MCCLFRTRRTFSLCATTITHSPSDLRLHWKRKLALIAGYKTPENTPTIGYMGRPIPPLTSGYIGGVDVTSVGSWHPLFRHRFYTQIQSLHRKFVDLLCLPRLH